LCDPSIMAIASMASGVADFMGQQNAQALQKKSYDEWFLQQEKNRKEQNEKQEASRKLAENAQAQAVQQVGAEGQEKAQDVEAARLQQVLMDQGSSLTRGAGPNSSEPVAGLDTSIADASLAGQGPGQTDQVFQTAMGAGINKAARDARERIASLANAQSYSGSSQDLNAWVRKALTTSGSEIDHRNENRRGDLAVYGVQQDVDPVQWSYTPGLRIG
jgi:hypothetical protein